MEVIPLLFIWLISWLVAGVIGGLIGMIHGKTGKGFLFGFLLGPIGWALILFDVEVATILIIFVILFAICFCAAPIVISMIQQGAKAEEKKSAELRRENDRRLAELDGDAPAATPVPLPRIATPTPAPTPTPEEREALARRQAQQRAQQDALNIARKYAAPK